MQLIRSTLKAEYKFSSEKKIIDHLKSHAACFYDLVTFAKESKNVSGELILKIQKEITDQEKNKNYQYNNECIFSEDEIIYFLESMREIFNFSFVINGFNDTSIDYILITMQVDMTSTEMRVFCPLIRHLYETPWNISLKDAIILQSKNILNEEYNSLFNCIIITDMAVTDFQGDWGYGHSMVSRGLNLIRKNSEYKAIMMEKRDKMSSVFSSKDQTEMDFRNRNADMLFFKQPVHDYSLNRFSNESLNIKRLDYYRIIIQTHYNQYAKV